jgi:hypothetical protein
MRMTNYRSAAMVSAHGAASCPASHSTTRPSQPAVEKRSPLPPGTGRSSTTALACAPTPPPPPGKLPCRCNAARAGNAQYLLGFLGQWVQWCNARQLSAPCPSVTASANRMLGCSRTAA